LIYPTRLAVLIAGAGVPVTLLVSAMRSDDWFVGLAWPVAVLLLFVVDAVLAGSGGTVEVALPPSAFVGETRDALVSARFTARPPARAEVALGTNALLALDDDGRAWIPLVDGRGTISVPMTMARRGTALVDTAWARWRGPLRLAWKGRASPIGGHFPILPDIRPVLEKGAQLLQRHGMQGLIAQLNRGDGSDLDALVEYRSGMDRRAIDWKQSARHHKLHAKEYRAERNSQIVIAVDSGRQMSEPVAAALLTGWLALKVGDRVALHAFDSRPRIAGGLVSGAAAFPELQRLAAAIDYSGDETNYTFALTALATRLTRRSMIVLFTEFTDASSADFLVRAARRVVQTHLLVVVVLKDEELETIANRAPSEVGDLVRSVTAAALLKDRRVVITRLQHLGVHVIEAEQEMIGERLIAGYVDLKRRNLL
jgi:uncharacterized protein (DUF58 family)